ARAGTAGSNVVNNSATDNDALTPQADLAVTITDGATSVVAGASNIYTITVTNNGPSMVDALVTDLFPADFTNVSWFVVLLPGAISASPAGGFGDIINATAELQPGGGAIFRASGQISASATGPPANTVTGAPPGGATDPHPPHNPAPHNDPPPGPIDLAVAITNAATTLVPGSLDTYTITVANNGSNTVSSFNLVDAIPADLLNATFGSPSAGSYDAGSGLWSGLSLANGQSVSISLSRVGRITTGTLATTVSLATPAGVTDAHLCHNHPHHTDTPPRLCKPCATPPPARRARL